MSTEFILKGRFMQTLLIKVNAAEGLHARPASLFCNFANKYRSNVQVRNATTVTGFVNAKSILLVLTLGVVQGHEIEITAEGDDEEKTIQDLKIQIESNFSG